jgi:hypothetical protein
MGQLPGECWREVVRDVHSALVRLAGTAKHDREASVKEGAVRLTSTTPIHGRRRLAAGGCGLTLLWMAMAGGAHAQSTVSDATAVDQGPSATLVQCVTAAGPAERSATFAGEMTILPGAARMSMRIELQEHTPGEAGFHAVVAPGLGVWRAAAAGVKTYKYDQQVLDLSAPAAYRAAVVFRWQNARGHEVKRVERVTSSCHQPAPASAPEEPAPSSSTGS